ncbi:MAG: biotin/lipoyl-binding protein [Oscillospiraceae bacterium]|nr:biotin/lipoyl-binding protein [Oscillospiraceae bacterium]
MKHYHVNVNGTDYEIEIEEISAEEAKAHQASAQATAAPAVASAPASVPTGAETVSAPMPGTILDVKASQGQSVNKGDVLMILEAMKMENEIMAPKSGKIVSVNVSKGASVKTGDVLCAIE